MELGGNEKFNSFLSQYGIPKETDIVAKYNTKAASVYRDRIQALAEGKPWRDPPVVKENSKSGNHSNSKPPLSGGGRNVNSGNSSGWDDWDNYDDGGSNSNQNIRRNNTVGDFRGSGSGSSPPQRSKSTQDIYSRTELEASAANKETFFARKMMENESRPEGLPPSQGGKYVGFGSTPTSAASTNNDDADVFSVVSQGFGRLSLVAASAAQSAANVVQAGTMEFTSKVKEGGYDHKVNETVNVVTAKTSEIGQRTWGIMKGVMALATQKVEEYTKEGPGWSNDNNHTNNGTYNQDCHRGWNSSTQPNSSSWDDWDRKQEPSKGTSSWDDWDIKDTRRTAPSKTSSSWDDWDTEDNRKAVPSKPKSSWDAKDTRPSKGAADNWAGWDVEPKGDDGFQDSIYQRASDHKGHNGNSESRWTEGGFM